MEAEQAATRIVGIVSRLSENWAHTLRQGEYEGLEQLQREVRDLAVSGRQSGYRRVAEMASILEVMLDPVAAGEEAASPEFRAIFQDYVRALNQLVHQPPDASPDDQIQAGSRVLFFSNDSESAQNLRPQLGYFGYSLERVTPDEDIVAALQRLPSDAVLIDLEDRNKDELDDHLSERIKETIGREIPLLATCDTGHIERRLSAARAGVIAYQVKPVDPYMLVDDLDNATSPDDIDEPAYQILLVEDSQTQAAYFTSMLVRAGMRVKVVHDPMQVLDVLSDYAADLILMDMYMPGCNGEELARVIRQVPEYASIPIVFLSAETEVERQLHAMSLGGDDFLTKPISPSHLIRSVTIRAERARTLRSFMVRDNLTGLLNHTRIKEQLKQEVARAWRHDSPVAFAMVDIDNFKQINDVYGHPVGDRVIKTLARVLQQRLRQTDFIGRYGGEEFGVIMPDATAHEARNVLDAVRQSFSRIVHAAGNESFQVTFSGGVAGYPDHEDAADLATRADEALYQAKIEGRNSVREYTEEPPDE